MSTKICSKCRKEKDLSDFYNCKSNRDGKAYYCIPCLRENRAPWEEKNKEYHLEYNRIKRRTEEFKAYRGKYDKERRGSDPQYKMRKLLSNRFKSALKHNSKCTSTMEILGCTIKELKHCIESKWLPGMTWDNYGTKGWHIDHIIPCAAFDLTKEEEQRKCFHYSNLQPLWWLDNLKKNNKI